MEHHRSKLRRFLCCHLSLEIVRQNKHGPPFPHRILINVPMHSPEGLREAYICGGLPPLVNEPDPVYERTYGRLSYGQDMKPMLTTSREGCGEKPGLLCQISRGR